MGRKNAAVWGNSRISEDDELKPVSKLERGGVRSMQFPTLVSLGWLHGVLRNILEKCFAPLYSSGWKLCKMLECL